MANNQGEIVDDRDKNEEEGTARSSVSSWANESEAPLVTDDERMVLFKKGVKFKRNGNSEHALHCLLGCLQGLKDAATFPMLPQCLHLIAELYSSNGNYETAISFVQAEKLYYETFLINVGGDGPQKTQSASMDKDKSGTSKPAHQTAENSQEKSDDATKASEYEKLAHMCLKQKNIQLALEYCGKAVKLQQAIYGENSPVTKKSLDLFTIIYAEMGKEQYSAAMKYATLGQKDPQSQTDAPQGDFAQSGVASSQQQQQQQQQQREEEEQQQQQKEQGREEQQKQHQQQLTTTAATSPPQPREQDEERVAAATTRDPSGTDVVNDHASVTSGRALLLYLIVTVLVAMVITVFCWQIWQDDFTTTYKQTLTRIKYYYFYHFRRAPDGNKFF